MPVPAHVRGQVGVPRGRVHELERLLVVLTHRPGDVVEHLARVGAVHAFPHPLLERGHRLAVVRPAVGPAVRPPPAFHFRQVTDGVPHGDLVGCLIRPGERHPVAQGDEDQPLPELGDTVTPGVGDAFLDRVAEGLQIMDHRPQDEHLPVQRHVRDVLHHHRRGLRVLDDVQEGPPQVLALVPGVTQPVADAVADLAPAGLGERLARRPARQQFHAGVGDEAGDLRDMAGVAEVPVQC